jgi:hypothetical protein
MILDSYNVERNKIINEITLREDYQGQIFASLNKFWYRDLDMSPYSSYADVYCTYVCRLQGQESIGHLYIDVVPELNEDFPNVIKELNKKYYDRVTYLKKIKEELVNERRVLVICKYEIQSVSLDRVREILKKHGIRLCILKQSEQVDEVDSENEE